MTNGDMIKAILKPYKICEYEYSVHIYMTEEDFWKAENQMNCDANWWNAPYVTPRMNLAETSQDCISRQAVDKLSRDLVHVTRDKADFLCNFWEGLNALPSVTPQRPRWIPVGEKLPEANRAVLTYIDTGATKTYCLAYWNDACKAWEEWIGYRLIEKDRDYKVIAWMPLPEPYKAESEE